MDSNSARGTPGREAVPSVRTPKLKKEHDENLKKRLEEIRKKNPKQRDARSRC